MAEPSVQWKPWRLSRQWRGNAGRPSMIYRIDWEFVVLLIAVSFILALTVLE